MVLPHGKSNKTPSQFLNPQNISRRRFFKKAYNSGVILAGAGIAFSMPWWFGNEVCNASSVFPVSGAENDPISNAPVARYWVSGNSSGVNCLLCHDNIDSLKGRKPDHNDGIIMCRLCAKECTLKEGERGSCRARINDKGTLRSLVYGRPVAMHIDPIEKKPFYHFLPGTAALSIGTAGCPLQCRFCQNWELSQARPEDFSIPFTAPAVIARRCKSRSVPVIAFTYNEPTVFIEYLTDIARIAKEDNIRSVLISCGLMKKEPLDEMCSVLDAIKIDLKGFSRDFYRRVCSAELEPVLRSIKQVFNSGIHLEIVNLVVPTLNDSTRMLTELVKWVAGEIGPDVPLHFTRFHPDYQMLNLAPTPVSTLEKAYDLAMTEGIRYPYVGNVPGHRGNHTYCPACGKPVILRSAFFVTEHHLKNGRCKYCNEPVAGVWS
ncbi:MAG TPA: AmmeMemoRadiSam system radical SAM enzyme [Desulfobacterales bacterium]|nr:AmmeMemoRadiSam system radical SAM enzyme [Desulfobacterales bacterium]